MNEKLFKSNRFEKINKLKSFLNDLEVELKTFTEAIGWNYEHFQNEQASTEMVTCSYNKNHRIPKSKIEFHQERCRWITEGYNSYDIPFPSHNGKGSFVTFDSELLNKITLGVSSSFVVTAIIVSMDCNQIHHENEFNSDIMQRNNVLTLSDKSTREVPNTSEKLDENFSREEKLAIYEYVIANTKKNDLFSDLYMHVPEKKEEKKELSSWEIAAAERDAKRRRASYRNKIHTNRKTYTEVMREVIDTQMDLLKDEMLEKEISAADNDKSLKIDSKLPEEKKGHKSHSSHDSRRRGSNDDRHHERKRSHCYQRENVDYGEGSSYKRRSSPVSSSYHCNYGSRADIKHRKWKSHKERSRSYKSSGYHKDGSMV